MTTDSRVHWWVTLALSGAAALLLPVFLGPRQGLPVESRRDDDFNVLRVAYTQALALDPHQRSFPLPVQNQFVLSLWEPLIECDPETGQPQPAAAESWEWSADRTTLTLRLRRDGRWSNGDPVTAADFVRAWRRLLRRDRDLAGVLFPLKNAEAYHSHRIDDPAAVGMEAVDDRTLRLTLAGVRSTFVTELADPLLVPLQSGTERTLQERAFLQQPDALVTNGAFTLRRAGPEGYRLVASAQYRDRASVRLAGIRFIRADNLKMARLLVAAGLADMMAPVPWSGPLPLPTSRRVMEAQEMALVVTALDLNVTRGPLRDLRVRRALSLAVDRAGSIPPADARRMVPAFSWVPDMPGRPRLNLLHEDVAEARRLLAEAGYPGGRGFPVLIMPISSAWRNDPYLQAWTDAWYRTLGIRTYPALDRDERRRTRMASGDYDVFYTGLLATVPDAGDMLATFAAPGLYSASRWENPEINRLLAEADRQSGRERLATLAEVERRAMEAVPTIPTLFERRQTLLGSEVQGWYADPLGRQALKRISLQLPPPKPEGRILL